MLSRDVAIAMRAPVTWFSAAAAALLVGHGFVLAVDLYAASSRSALENTLMAREFDPLLGIVRPTLGGLNLALSLFGPLAGARVLAVEKDRRTFYASLLESGSVVGFVVSKWLASATAAALPCASLMLLLLIWRALGGHLMLAETLIAASGQLLYACLVTAIGIVAAAFARNLSQAATAALLAIAASWAIDAADGFSALAWLGGAAAWSPSTYLVPFEQGTLQVDGLCWFAGSVIGLLALACIGCRFDLHRLRKGVAVVGAIAALCVICALARTLPGAWDISEGRRHSLPPTAAAALRDLPGRLRITANLDREDSRRRQLETDVLAKLRLARPDLRVIFPPDERSAPAALQQDHDYGDLTIELGEHIAQTTSTSRRELTTLIFQLAGRPLPDWTQPEYPGYPMVVEGTRRSLVLGMSYLGLPFTFLLIGIFLTRDRRHS